MKIAYEDALATPSSYGHISHAAKHGVRLQLTARQCGIATQQLGLKCCTLGLITLGGAIPAYRSGDQYIVALGNCSLACGLSERQVVATSYDLNPVVSNQPLTYRLLDRVALCNFTSEQLVLKPSNTPLSAIACLHLHRCCNLRCCYRKSRSDVSTRASSCGRITP